MKNWKPSLKEMIFIELSTRDKWKQYKELKNNKTIVWCCSKCGETVSDGVRYPEPFDGCSIHCGDCGAMLVERTPGGQSDPFNYFPKQIK